MKKREIIAAVLTAAVILTMCEALSWVLIPKRLDYGATWGYYLEEERDTIDVMFYGSSLAYCDVVPSVIYDETGITSYVMGGPEQTIPMTYYYIKETFRTQSPDVIFVEATGLLYPEYTDYTKVNIGYMPRGINRFLATFTYAEKEEKTGLIFPLYNYHSRWNEIGLGDIKMAFNRYGSPDMLAGYTYLDIYGENIEKAERDFGIDEENYRRNVEYMKKIADYAEEKGAKTVFYIAPCKLIMSQQDKEMVRKDMESIENAIFMDFNDVYDSIGIDETRDWYDNLHFNSKGAKNFSRFVADYITENNLAQPNERADAELWNKRTEHFEKLSANELKPHGK